MPIIANPTLARLRDGKLALGFGVSRLRTAATPALAKAAGYDWLFLDMEHGALGFETVSEICLAALGQGITPMVRVYASALDEGARALDNGAQGIVVPHVDTAEFAREVAAAFRFPPQGHRSWGGPAASYGFRLPGAEVAQAEINREVLVVAMIETGRAVANVDAIAAVPGIDCLFVGTNDLCGDLGVPGQYGHERVVDAYAAVTAACRRHGKFAGMGGVQDEACAARYVGMGARFVQAGTDQQFLLAGASARAAFFAGL